MNLPKHIGAKFAAGLLSAAMMTMSASAVAGTVDASGGLRLRNGVGTDTGILATLPDGAQVEVTGVAEEGWYQVAYQKLNGFVSGEYLTVNAEEAKSLPAVKDPVYGKVTEGPLNVRSQPSTDGDKVKKLAEGAVVQITETLDGWYQIEAGYISADYAVQIDAAEAQAAATKGQEIADYALQFVGYPYVHGGSSPKGFDCSGFTSYVYKQFGYSINRTCSGQLDNGTPVSINDLQPGDIVIFNKGNASTRATHVGLYIGNNQFVHASTPTKGVIINKMSDYYYTTGFVGARRIVD